MYIPSLFSTAANGCPSGSNTYALANWTATNLNSGLRPRVSFSWNEYTNTAVGESIAGSGSYGNAIILGNGQTANINALVPPAASVLNTAIPIFGYTGMTISKNYNVTASNGQDINYCYFCNRKQRWTFGSYATQTGFPLADVPLTLAILSSPSGSPTNGADYTIQTFEFSPPNTASVEGYGPIWLAAGVGGSGNGVHYYIQSVTDITP